MGERSDRFPILAQPLIATSSPPIDDFPQIDDDELSKRFPPAAHRPCAPPEAIWAGLGTTVAGDVIDREVLAFVRRHR